MITLTTEQAQQIEEALEELCGSIDFYNKYGPDWTHKDGTESFNVSVLLDRADDISKAIIALREALDHSGGANEMVVGWDRVKPEAIASDPLYQQGYLVGYEAGLVFANARDKAEQAEQEQFDMNDHPPHRLCECRKCMEYFTPLPDCDAFAASGKPIAEQANTQLMEGFRPVSEMIAEHKQDPKKAAAIEKAKMRKAEQEPVAVVEITYGREPECYVTGNIDDFPEGVFKLYAAPVRTKDLTDAHIGGKWGDGWACPVCGGSNSGALLKCHSCEHKRPADDEIKGWWPKTSSSIAV